MPSPPVRFIDEHPLAADAFARAEILYTDLDGTLLGLGGGLLVGGEGQPTLSGIDAVMRLNAAGLTVAVCSGRNRLQLGEISRLLGWRGFIAELGCVIVPDRGAEPVYFIGRWSNEMLHPGETPFQAIERAGALDALREAFPNRIENHAPYHLNREATHVLRGGLDCAQAQAVLDELELPVEIVDNGIIHPLTTTLVGIDEIHGYHLLPAGVTKAGAVMQDLERRGLSREQALAVGDSASDVSMAEAVELAIVVVNALDDARVREAVTKHDNIAATHGMRGDGWAELADAWLAARG